MPPVGDRRLIKFSLQTILCFLQCEMGHMKLISIGPCDLFSWYFIILNLVFPTGPCSPMRGTVMISAWQKKGVSRHCYQVLMISTRYYQMCAGISLSAYSCSTGISTQRDCMPLLSHPIICKGKNIHSYTTDHINHLTFPQYLFIRWRTGGVG